MKMQTLALFGMVGDRDRRRRLGVHLSDAVRRAESREARAPA